MFSSRTSSPGVGEERAAVGGQSWWPSGPCRPTGCRCALLQRAPAHPEMRIPGLSPLAAPFPSKVVMFCALGALPSGASGVRSSERSPACETDSPRSPSLCRQTHTVPGESPNSDPPQPQVTRRAGKSWGGGAGTGTHEARRGRARTRRGRAHASASSLRCLRRPGSAASLGHLPPLFSFPRQTPS